MAAGMLPSVICLRSGKDSRVMYLKGALQLVAVNLWRNALNTRHSLQVAAPKQDAAASAAEVLHNVHERCYVEIRRI